MLKRYVLGTEMSTRSGEYIKRVSRKARKSEPNVSLARGEGKFEKARRTSEDIDVVSRIRVREAKRGKRTW